MNVRAKVWFRETLTLGGYLRARLQQSQTWYYGESLGMRLARRILRLPMAPLVERIRYGHVGAATGIRRRAYEQGLRAISQHPLPLDQFDPGFAADMRLLAEKFLLDHLFSKYEFHGMAAQFAQEHPDKDVVLLADRDLFPALDLSSP